MQVRFMKEKSIKSYNTSILSANFVMYVFFAIMLVLKPFYLQYFKIHKFVLQSIGSPVDLLMLLFLKIGLKF